MDEHRKTHSIGYIILEDLDKLGRTPEHTRIFREYMADESIKQYIDYYESDAEESKLSL